MLVVPGIIVAQLTLRLGWNQIILYASTALLTSANLTIAKVTM